jgi:hypothetical protein
MPADPHQSFVLVPNELVNDLLNELRHIKELFAAERRQAPWLDAAGVAAYAAMTEQAVRDAERHGHLKAHRSTTGRLRFRVEDVDAFLRGSVDHAENG